MYRSRCAALALLHAMQRICDLGKHGRQAWHCTAYVVLVTKTCAGGTGRNTCCGCCCVLISCRTSLVHVLMAITQHTHSACLLVVFLVPAWPLHAAALKCCCCKQAWPREHLAFGCYVCGLVAAVVWQLCLLIAQTNDAVVTQYSPLLFVGCAMACFLLSRGQQQPPCAAI